MFEMLMLIRFVYAGFCYLLPETAERESGERDEGQSGETRKGRERSGRLNPRGRSCRSRNEAAPKRPLLSRAG
jgi:hypothetical protein